MTAFAMTAFAFGECRRGNHERGNRRADESDVCVTAFAMTAVTVGKRVSARRPREAAATPTRDENQAKLGGTLSRD